MKATAEACQHCWYRIEWEPRLKRWIHSTSGKQFCNLTERVQEDGRWVHAKARPFPLVT
jgi:hypothetical protein